MRPPELGGWSLGAALPMCHYRYPRRCQGGRRRRGRRLAKERSRRIGHHIGRRLVRRRAESRAPRRPCARQRPKGREPIEPYRGVRARPHTGCRPARSLVSVGAERGKPPPPASSGATPAVKTWRSCEERCSRMPRRPDEPATWRRPIRYGEDDSIGSEARHTTHLWGNGAVVSTCMQGGATCASRLACPPSVAPPLAPWPPWPLLPLLPPP